MYKNKYTCTYIDHTPPISLQRSPTHMRYCDKRHLATQKVYWVAGRISHTKSPDLLQKEHYLPDLCRPLLCKSELEIQRILHLAATSFRPLCPLHESNLYVVYIHIYIYIYIYTHIYTNIHLSM